MSNGWRGRVEELETRGAVLGVTPWSLTKWEPAASRTKTHTG